VVVEFPVSAKLLEKEGVLNPSSPRSGDDSTISHKEGRKTNSSATDVFSSCTFIPRCRVFVGP